MRYDTMIFDLDGTLLDTLGDLADSTNYALSACGLPTRTEEEIRAFVGNGIGKLIACAVPDGTAAKTKTKCLTLFRAHYVLNMENKTAPYPGILDLLKRLGREGCRLAIVSNKVDKAVKGLALSYFSDLIPVAVGETEGIDRKPAPDMVYSALTELGADPSRAVYVGDSEVDLATAQNAGLPCIAVSWGFRSREFLQAHGAVCVVDDTQALLAELKL